MDKFEESDMENFDINEYVDLCWEDAVELGVEGE